MRARRVLLAAAAAAALAAFLWWARAPEPTEEPPAPAAPASRAPAPSPAAPVPGPVPAPAASVAPLEDAMLGAELRARLRSPALTPALIARMARGDLAGVARELAAARAPGSAALLADLAELCRGPGLAAAGEAASLGAAAEAGRDPAAAATLAALGRARAAASRRLAAACAATPFDPGAIREALESSARGGDAASLERLGLAGRGDPGRLASAALLGAPGAQLRLGLETLPRSPADARGWLEAAARQDADAEAFLGNCLLAGCGAPPDPAAGRAALESAARRGAPFALGVLASGPEQALRWSPPGAFVAPLPPAGGDGAGLEPTERYAWAAFAADLASQGCFGFDLDLAFEMLAARRSLASALSPSAAADGERAAAALVAAHGAEARGARGCE